MSEGSADSIPNPVGHSIEKFRVLGREIDGESHWVSADILLRVKEIGRFSVFVVTKQQFLDEKIEETLNTDQALEKLLSDSADLYEQRPPFVLNDAVITDEVLTRKFQDRTVEEDLALSLHFVDSLDD